MLSMCPCLYDVVLVHYGCVWCGGVFCVDRVLHCSVFVVCVVV